MSANPLLRQGVFCLKIAKKKAPQSGAGIQTTSGVCPCFDPEERLHSSHEIKLFRQRKISHPHPRRFAEWSAAPG